MHSDGYDRLLSRFIRPVDLIPSQRDPGIFGSGPAPIVAAGRAMFRVLAVSCFVPFLSAVETQSSFVRAFSFTLLVPEPPTPIALWNLNSLYYLAC